MYIGTMESGWLEDHPYYTFRPTPMDLNIDLIEVWLRRNTGNLGSFDAGT